jgi:arylformamidase
MSKLIDVSMRLSPTMPICPGQPGFEIQHGESPAPGGRLARARIAMGTHTGTHVDAPFGFFSQGATVEQIPLEILIGKARVVAIDSRSAIERAELEALDLRDDIRILIKTRMSGHLRHGALEQDSVHLTADAATYLVQAGIKLVGLDSLSIEAQDRTDYPAHERLLSSGVVVVEGLDLTEAEPGEYEMLCLPLAIAGGDGAPARVVLRTRL